MRTRLIATAVLAAAAVACGSTTTTTTPPPVGGGGTPDAGGGGVPDAGRPDAGQPDAGGGGTATLTIQNFTFSPSNLTVSPGTTVTVMNKDAMVHSVTSQSAPNMFVPGAVNGISFDTTPFTGTRTFTIPSNAPHGTVIPYFCTVHRQGMANSGQITVQ